MSSTAVRDASTSPVHVRRADEGDVDALAEVAGATFVLACPPDMPAAAVEAFIAQNLTPERFADYVADAGRAVLIAEEDASEQRGAVGYAMLVHGEPYDADVRAVVRHLPTTELSKIYVLPGAQGAGVARELMAAAVEVAHEIGAAGIWLGTNQQNVRAQRFYEKTGFERIGTKRFWVGDHYEDDFVYELALQA